ncbi:MAG TPA: glutaminyl-peptide cyclotransferase [Candidatus Sumerlaeota bacterium]|nr:glutaminyl-peptide cyclotransferase [Candidatus Sumerlaeota bacterium]HPS00192.1 glutaminyl-peptide cyclotransferase [Candidatus Sumerlaeota bacterium]
MRSVKKPENKKPHPPQAVPSSPVPRKLRQIGFLVVVIFLSLVSVAIWAMCNSQGAPTLAFEVVNRYPHDTAAYTQGLLYHEGKFYESTGRYRRSTLREVEIETGRVLRSRKLDDRYFAEGLALYDNRLIQLTWQSGVGFAYRLDTFEPIGQPFEYEGEGWGLTNDGKRLIFSDGTDTLRFLDPDSYKVLDTLHVTDGGKPVPLLNELELVEGTLYANVWRSNRIARISLSTGAVQSWLDLTSLTEEVHEQNPDAEVLNGIAWDAAGGRLFVTGKNWPTVFEIRVKKSR